MFANLGVVTLLNHDDACALGNPCSIQPSKLGATVSHRSREGVCALPNTEDDSTSKPLRKQHWRKEIIPKVGLWPAIIERRFGVGQAEPAHRKGVSSRGVNQEIHRRATCLCTFENQYVLSLSSI